MENIGDRIIVGDAEADNMEKFSKHIEKIRIAKDIACEVTANIRRSGSNAESSINMAWQVLFDYFCRTETEDISLSELNTISGIIQKLVTSNAKNSDSEGERVASGALSEKTLREIERQLKLL